LTIPNAQAANAGSYTATISNSAGTVTTAAATLTVTFCRIVNFSARAQTGQGSTQLTLGFVVSGNNKTLLLRGIGPGLIPFGVSNVLPDPQLTVYSATNAIAPNTVWQTASSAATMPALAAQIGAFPLQNGSLDSALSTTVNAGTYTEQVAGASGDTGTAMAEVYDADSNLSSRLLNASARMQVNVSSGNLNAPIIGFVISGTGQKTVLIRGIGPSLAAFGVGGVLANPQINLFSGGTQIASNAAWSTGSNFAQLLATFAQVGAFALPTGSLDAAILVTLQPGTYTVQVSGVGNTSGVALLELYDVL
jgi:hypothetical protein